MLFIYALYYLPCQTVSNSFDIVGPYNTWQNVLYNILIYISQNAHQKKAINWWYPNVVFSISLKNWPSDPGFLMLKAFPLLTVKVEFCELWHNIQLEKKTWQLVSLCREHTTYDPNMSSLNHQKYVLRHHQSPRNMWW